MGRGGSPGHVPADEGTRYTWTCPICERSRTSFTGTDAGAETALERALNALESHVQSSGGEGHGPTGTVPAGTDRDCLVEFVTLEGTLE